MVYASLTKGTHALRAAALLAGARTGRWCRDKDPNGNKVCRTSTGQWKAACPSSPQIPARWTGEMREIAETYANRLGITSGFHEGAEWIYDMLSQSPLADESRADADREGPLDRSNAWKSFNNREKND